MREQLRLSRYVLVIGALALGFAASSCNGSSNRHGPGANTPPQVTVGPVVGTQTGFVGLAYDLTDADSDIITISAEYSTDSGVTYFPATSGPGGDGTGPLQGLPTPTAYVYQWDSRADLGAVSVTARLRITPWDSQAGIRDESADFLLVNVKDIFMPGPDMKVARMRHTATLLNDGRVLVAGGAGAGSTVLDTAEIFSPGTDDFTLLPATMTTRRSGHTATLLSDGTVLLAGGEDTPGGRLDSTEIFDPLAGSFQPGPTMNQGRAHHAAAGTATDVIISGGTLSPLPVVITEVDDFDILSGTFGLPGIADQERQLHTADLLPNGNVLFFAGSGLDGLSTEEYDPVSGTSPVTVTLKAFLEISQHASSLLLDGTVLITGGGPGRNIISLATSYDSGYVYTAGGGPSPVGPLNTARKNHTSSTLGDGRGLVAGGQLNFAIAATTDAELYDPTAQTFTFTASMAEARAIHTAVVLDDGRVLMAGGSSDGIDPIPSSELYQP